MSSYVSQQFLVCDNSSSGNLRAWGSAVSAAIGSMNWVQTGDPQVNWTTITTGSGVVYEFWRMADSLQTGASQIFLRVGYNTGSGTVGITLTLAAGTDGSGNLTGYTSNVIAPSTVANQGANGFECNFSGDSNRLALMLWRNLSTTFCVLVVIERTHNTDGTDSADGVTIVYQSNSTGGQQTLVFGVGAGNASATRSFCLLGNAQNASGVFNNNIPVSPVFPDYGKYGNPMTGVCAVHTQDVAEGCQFNSTIYGATRTYLATANFGAVSPANMKLCMRYD